MFLADVGFEGHLLGRNGKIYLFAGSDIFRMGYRW